MLFVYLEFTERRANDSFVRTGKLPKNYSNDVDPDPERWLPRRERSYYKGKRQKKGASTVGKFRKESVVFDKLRASECGYPI